MQKYQQLEQLGTGSFGEVHKYRNKTTGELVAVKRLRQKFKDWEQCLELAEVKALRKLAHPHIVKLKELIRVKEEAFLVFEYCPKSLLAHCSQKGALAEAEVLRLGRQVAEGMNYMHRAGMFHRDLKPQNFLVTEDQQVKISDFGIAKEVRSKPPFTEYVATRWYRAPQLLLRAAKYSPAVDVYAFGCILAEMLTSKPLFCGGSQADQLSKVLAVLGTPADWAEGHRLAALKGISLPRFENKSRLPELLPGASQQFVDLIEQCLRVDHSKRPSFAAILQHQVFTAPVPKMRAKEQPEEWKGRANKVSASLSRNESVGIDRQRGRSLVKEEGQFSSRKMLGMLAMETIKKRY